MVLMVWPSYLRTVKSLMAQVVDSLSAEAAGATRALVTKWAMAVVARASFIAKDGSAGSRFALW